MVLQVLVLAALVAIANCQTTTYSYTSFGAGDLSNFQLNGSAASLNPTGDGRILLTQAESGRGGSAFIRNSIPLIGPNGFKASFSTAFSFQMPNSGGIEDQDGKGADGIMFVVNSVTNQLG
eukprot:TRINITY_DN10038_c0_g1_i1.p1 TRINITY_DN10038_c0_g1~~TRINITY_DN10038_c0_g1_i1.p1  ORF type:complete len:121 (+),score=7.71 TRINITY_DN10038_c0_g1_i1:477-839(+)